MCQFAPKKSTFFRKIFSHEILQEVNNNSLELGRYRLESIHRCEQAVTKATQNDELASRTITVSIHFYYFW